MVQNIPIDLKLLLYLDILFGLTEKINTHYTEDEKSNNNPSLHYSYTIIPTRVAIQYKNKTNDNTVSVNTFV